MNFLTKVLGFFLIVFSFAFYQASPMQRGHGHGYGHGHGHGPKHSKHYYYGPPRPYYRPVVYHRPPRHHYKRYYYEPVRPRYYSHRPHRVSRPVIIVKL